MHVLVTGSAGFIGYHVTRALLERGHRVTGLDNLDEHTGLALKRARLARLEHARFGFVHGDIADAATVERVCASADGVVHLAAKVGVRHSARHPEAYVSANLVGFANVIEAARRRGVSHFVYASSSSVYGGNLELPFRETQATERPLSFYAATKKANELMAASYSHLFALPTTGLRFFTAYGPWGRPDMAVFDFCERILAARPIQLFGEGALRRDFTYVDDTAGAVVELLARPPAGPEPARLLNVGSGEPIAVTQLVSLLEAALGRRAIIEHAPRQDGDMDATWADASALEACLGPRTWTPLERGLERFVTWYREEYAGRCDTSSC